MNFRNKDEFRDFVVQKFEETMTKLAAVTDLVTQLKASQDAANQRWILYVETQSAQLADAIVKVTNLEAAIGNEPELDSLLTELQAMKDAADAVNPGGNPPPPPQPPVG